MKILISCEYSGIVRDEFNKLGHDATSCDLLPCESNIPGKHYVGDVRDILYSEKWDLMIGHPPCTRLCNSGVRWLAERNLWQEMIEGCDFFNLLWNAPIKRICLENPIPHKYAKERIGNYTQIIHPWQHGHSESKATCIWLKNLPKIVPTKIIDKKLIKQTVWLTSPGPNRAKERSKTFSGIAKALAEQFTRSILNEV